MTDFAVDSNNYLVLAYKPNDDSFVLDQLSRVQLKYQLVKGEPRAAGFPEGVTHTVSNDYPRDMGVLDVFRSPNLVCLISERVHRFLVQRGLKNVEFLPVTLLNHRQKPVAPYFLLHPTHPVDCLDMVASGAKPGIGDKAYVGDINSIVIQPERLDPELQVLKIKGMFDHIVFGRDLAAEISAAGFTGFEWIAFRDFHRS